MRSSKNSRFLVAILALLFVGCGGGQDEASAPRESPFAATEASVIAGPACGGCVFGPFTYVRQRREPTIERALLGGDPAADYVIEIDDHGTQGADGSVTLDGVELLAPRGIAEVGPRHITLNVKLRAQSLLDVRLTGKPGSQLTIAIRGGAKIVGAAGGSVTAPGGAVRIDIPANSLNSPTEINIGPVAGPVPEGNLGPAFELGPTGLAFSTPAKLTVKFDPAVVGPDWSARILTIAVVSGSEWTDVPTTVDTEDNLLVGTLEHFSIYSFKEKSSGCVTSGNAIYDIQMANVGQRLFNLAKPPTSSTGCVTEGYLQAGYSEFWPSLENHAGVDFRAQTDLTPVHALFDGYVEFQVLNFTSTNKIAGQSTLTIRSNIRGVEYRILYLHCESQIQKRIINGSKVVIGPLSKDSQIRQGDEVCQTGRIGAASSHLHLEVKRVGMDSINPLRALSGSHCPNQSFTNFAGVATAGCPTTYISENTVDPIVVLHIRDQGVCLSSAPPSGTLPYLALVCADDGSCPSGQVAMLVGGNNSANPPIPRVRYCVPR